MKKILDRLSPVELIVLLEHLAAGQPKYVVSDFRTFGCRYCQKEGKR